MLFVWSGLPRHEHYVFFGNNTVKVDTDFNKSYHLSYQKDTEREKCHLTLNFPAAL